MIYMIEPLDSFFFRNAVPFEAGGETVAVESGIMPLPSVYAGALRRMAGVNPETHGKIKIGFNGLYLEGEYLFPAPADLYWQCQGKTDTSSDDSRQAQKECSKNDEDKGVMKSMHICHKPVSNFPLDYCLFPENEQQKDKEHRSLFLGEKALKKYLNASKDQYDCLDLEKGYMARERKIGIQLDDQSRTTKNHQFYQIETVRPSKEKNLKLAAEVNFRKSDEQVKRETAQISESVHDFGLKKKEPGKGSREAYAVKLGGEGKLAAVRKCEHSLQLDVELSDTKYFKIYLATPAIFEKGWFPGWLDKKDKKGHFTDNKKHHVKVKLLAACVGRTIPCGGFGFDKESGTYHPREMRFAVPAGSVYYFKLEEGSFEDAVKAFHGKCISDYRENKGFRYPAYKKYRYCDRGFGYALVGKVGKKQEEIFNG